MLGRNRLNADALSPLFTRHSLPALRTLYLCDNPLGDSGVELLAFDTRLQLEVLHLGGCDLTPHAPLTLARWHGLRHLRELHLDSSAIGDTGASALRYQHALPHLEILGLTACALTARGVHALTRRPLPALHTLHLASNPIGDPGANLLARSPLLAQLRTLTLSACHITDAGALALLRSPHLSDNLRWLSLSGNLISAQTAEALRVRLGPRVAV